MQPSESFLTSLTSWRFSRLIAPSSSFGYDVLVAKFSIVLFIIPKVFALLLRSGAVLVWEVVSFGIEVAIEGCGFYQIGSYPVQHWRRWHVCLFFFRVGSVKSTLVPGGFAVFSWFKFFGLIEIRESSFNFGCIGLNYLLCHTHCIRSGLLALKLAIYAFKEFLHFFLVLLFFFSFFRPLSVCSLSSAYCCKLSSVDGLNFPRQQNKSVGHLFKTLKTQSTCQ